MARPLQLYQGKFCIDKQRTGRSLRLKWKRSFFVQAEQGFRVRDSRPRIYGLQAGELLYRNRGDIEGDRHLEAIPREALPDARGQGHNNVHERSEERRVGKEW